MLTYEKIFTYASVNHVDKFVDAQHTGDIFIEPHDKTHTWTGSYVGLASVSINGIPRGFISAFLQNVTVTMRHKLICFLIYASEFLDNGFHTCLSVMDTTSTVEQNLLLLLLRLE
jgi:hypothetical protein